MAFDANDLSPHESYVVDRTREGEIADFTPMIGGDGAKPAVRAGFVRRLLLQLDPSWAVRSPGVRLRGVRIEGALDLTDCSGAGGAGLSALSLENCDIGEVIDVSHSRLARLSLKGSRLCRLVATGAQINDDFDLTDTGPIGPPGREVFVVQMHGASIDGDFVADRAKLARATDSDEHALFLENATIKGSLLLCDGFEAFGCVWLVGIRIGRNLECDGSRFLNRSADGRSEALVAENAEIGGDVFLRSGFLAEGEVWFEGAHIHGDLDLEGGVIQNEGGDALSLCGANVDGTVLTREQDGVFKAAGKITLQGARIGRNLNLRGAEIANPRRKNGAAHKSEFDTAIDAAGIEVGGAALLQGANIKGEVFLADARIDGYLALGGGRFINGGGWAIRAPNIRVGGNLTLKIDETGFAPHGQKTVIEGGAKFDRAQIEGAVAWLNLELRGPGPEAPEAKGPIFSLADAVIGGPLQARALVAQQDARIDLSGASCNALDDDLKTGWGMDRASLDLDGFSYTRVEARAERWRHRLAWLKRGQRHGHFSPQPYTQLAEVYARAGRREDARRILLAQHDQRTVSAGPLTWALSSLFGLIAGYGFAPIRAARALILFLALGITAVVVMNAQGALVRPDGRACNGAVEPALYAIDVALPVIDLGQEQRCAPGRAPRAVLPAGIELPDTDWRLFEGVALWRWGQSLYAILGAILSALAIVTFSGVLKPKDD